MPNRTLRLRIEPCPTTYWAYDPHEPFVTVELVNELDNLGWYRMAFVSNALKQQNLISRCDGSPLPYIVGRDYAHSLHISFPSEVDRDAILTQVENLENVQLQGTSLRGLYAVETIGESTKVARCFQLAGGEIKTADQIKGLLIVDPGEAYAPHFIRFESMRRAMVSGNWLFIVVRNQPPPDSLVVIECATSHRALRFKATLWKAIPRFLDGARGVLQVSVFPHGTTEMAVKSHHEKKPEYRIPFTAAYDLFLQWENSRLRGR